MLLPQECRVGAGGSFTSILGGVESGAGHTENREGSGEPQKLSVILPSGEGAELLSVLRCPLPQSWAFPGFSGILWASILLW